MTGFLMTNSYQQRPIMPQQNMAQAYARPTNLSIQNAPANQGPTHFYDDSKLPANFMWLTKGVKTTTKTVNTNPFLPQQSQLTIKKDMYTNLATSVKPTVGPDNSRVPKFPFNNDLKDLFKENKSIIKAIVIRTFGAKDKNQNGLIDPQNAESGTFLNAINRLDELKVQGINTLHVLPISEPGEINKLGEAGSLYAPKDYNVIDPHLDTPNNGLSVKDEMKIFVNECHKRGIRVMVDLPSCGSIDMRNNPKYHDWFLFEKKVHPDGSVTVEDKVPATWHDIRMFDPYKNKDTGELKNDFLDYHKQFVDLLVDVGVDGIRADVARAKPEHFWSELIDYSHKKDPGFAWLAESYVHEDASPTQNVPSDRPEVLLRAGFDSYYGQWHILQSMDSATAVNDYITSNIEMTQQLPPGKSMIGSFYTHDDLSVMEHGGPLYGNFAASLLSTLPMVNPYYIDGFETGDPKQLDIFNFVEAPHGKNPELFYNVAKINKTREENAEVIGKGSYIPLNVKSNYNSDQVLSFVRHLNGKTMLVVANKDINARHIAKIDVPTMSGNQPLKDMIPAYGSKSKLLAEDNTLSVDLAPGRVHMFEINTPNIEQYVPKDKIHKQYL